MTRPDQTKKVQNDPKLSQMVPKIQNGQNWSEMVPNGLKWSKMVPSGVQMLPIGPILFQMVLNGVKWSQTAQIVLNVPQ